MTLPRLRASLRDDRAAARVLEHALRHERGVVPLATPVVHQETHVLEITFSGGKVVEVLVDPTGPAEEGGQPMELRPLNPSQMAEIFALIERLDVPARRGGYSAVAAREPSPPPRPAAHLHTATSVSPTADGQQPRLGQRPGAYVMVTGEDQDDEPTILRKRAASEAVTLPPPPDPEVELVPESQQLRSTGPEAFSDTMMPTDLGYGARDATLESGGPRPAPASSTRGGPSPASPRPSAAPPSSARAPATSAPAPGSAPPDSGSSLIGRTIAGKYELVSSIGRGATAEVYRAQHVTLKRAVAVKILHQENQNADQFVKRFKAEGRTLSRLEHQNIARVIDFGEDPGGLLYLVMEMITGKSLEFILWAAGTLPVPKVLDLAMQTCSALAFAHDEGIVHRDVKPENILLVPHKDDDGDPCEIVKVCDFGLAKLQDPDAENAELTMRGAVCGSPAYMSPEQIRGEPLDARTDIYALAITLYEALTGKYPHEAIGLTDLFAKKLMADPTPLRVHLPDVDPALDAAIMRAMAREPADRQADARVLRKELRAVLQGLKR